MITLLRGAVLSMSASEAVVDVGLDARGEVNRRTTPGGILEPPITGAMVADSPPPPVMDPSECPPGSSISAGLCRTPEGYLRPLPDWLVEFLEQDR